jgi:hypothetical protein
MGPIFYQILFLLASRRKDAKAGEVAAKSNFLLSHLFDENQLPEIETSAKNPWGTAILKNLSGTGLWPVDN